MKQSIVSTCFWIMLKSIMLESLFACILVTMDANILAGILFAGLGFVFAAIICAPLMLFVCPLVRVALLLPYSFGSQMVWLTFALTACIVAIVFIPFEVVSGKIDEVFARFLISLSVAISFACWTSKKSLKEIRQNL